MEYTVNDLKVWNEKIEEIADSKGLSFYPQEYEIISYKEMLGYEAYIGMPSHYPHWSYGKAYEKNKTLYKYNLTGLPYEMVINSNPCLAYLMKENTLLLQILTMAHVYGHNDFFKNNRLFKEGTRADYTFEMFKTGADAVRTYINDPSIGCSSVEKILDAAHAIRYQTSRVPGEKRIDSDTIAQRITEDYDKKNERKSILDSYKKAELPDLNKVPLEPEDDILYFIACNGELDEWEKNILEMVRQETFYFIPQIETKIMNEGWASYWHYNILKDLNLGDSLHLEFIKRHNDVIAPRVGGINPYFLGFKLFEDLERRYGKEKLFEIRSVERDESFIRRYLTEDLCVELNLFQYGKKGSDYLIQEVSDETGWTSIRDTLCSASGMGMIPSIKIVDMSKKDKTLTIQHSFDGRELNSEYTEATLKYIVDLWGHSVKLLTKLNGKETKIICDETKKITVL